MIYIHFWSSNLAPGHNKGQKWAENEAEAEAEFVQKHKIDNIEENNEVSVFQLHQYVIQVGRIEKQ